MQVITPLRLSTPSRGQRSRTAAADICPQLLRDVQAYLTLPSRPRSSIERLRESWRTFYETYDTVIRRFAVRCKIPLVDLEECTQEIWVKLLKKLPNFRYHAACSQFHTWLFAVVRNHVVDRLRRDRNRAVGRLTDLVEANLASSDSDPSHIFDRVSDYRELQRASELLKSMVSDKSYRTLQLRWIEGKSINEIANVLELTPAQVRLRQCRMKKQLQRLINSQMR